MFSTLLVLLIPTVSGNRYSRLLIWREGYFRSLFLVSLFADEGVDSIIITMQYQILLALARVEG